MASVCKAIPNPPSPSKTESTGSSLPSIYTLAVTSPHSDLLKGVVALNGSSVMKLDLTVKASVWNKGLAYKVCLAQGKTITVEQLLNVTKYMARVDQIIDCLVDCPDALKYFKLTNDLLEAATKTIHFLTSADSCLRFPNGRIDRKAFNPPLPPELVVEFYIHNAMLITSMAVLGCISGLSNASSNSPLILSSSTANQATTPSKSTQRSAKKEQASNPDTSTKQFITYNGQSVEMVLYHYVESAVPSITTTVAMLREICDHARDILQKLQVFVNIIGEDHLHS